MAFAPMVLGVLGAGVSAVGAIAGGQAQANALNYESQVAANNAIIAEQNATYATEAGIAKTQTVGLQNADTEGAIKTAMAANNVDVNTGSAANVQTSQRELGLLNEQTTMNNAELQAYGYQTEATNYTAQSGLYSLEAQQAPIGADIGAAGGFLSSASALGFKSNSFGLF